MEKKKNKTQAKLSWKEIEKMYDKQWVQLIDFDWPDEAAKPKSGVVVANSKERKIFDRLICDNRQKNSAILYVGTRKLPPNTVLVASRHVLSAA